MGSPPPTRFYLVGQLTNVPPAMAVRIMDRGRNSRLPQGSLILPCAEQDLNWQQDESGRNWSNCTAICTILHRATSISYSLCIFGKNVSQSHADTESGYFIPIKVHYCLQMVTISHKCKLRPQTKIYIISGKSMSRL